MDPRRGAILGAIGIERFVRRAPMAGGQDALSATAVPALAVDMLDWTPLAAQVAACTRCALAKGRLQAVFGRGARRARWLVVGEAPGEEEEQAGEPFVGRTGQLLDAMLRAAGLAPEDVHVTHVVKCRPAADREPRPEEVHECRPYLERQIALVEPRLILAVGRIAAQNLLGVDTPLAALRGRIHRLAPIGLPVVVTYHPAYLLRSPSHKREAWADLRQAMEVAHGDGL
jgi:uracil-DNA glycosylase